MILKRAIRQLVIMTWQVLWRLHLTQILLLTKISDLKLVLLLLLFLKLSEVIKLLLLLDEQVLNLLQVASLLISLI